MTEKDKEKYGDLLDSLSKELISGKSLTGKDGVLTPLIKSLLELSLEGELDAHLESTRSSAKNRRNGKSSKQVQSSLGGFELLAPRDRNGSFDPKTVRKRQTKISQELDAQVLSLYSRGMSYRDIQAHLKEIYDLDLSNGVINAITDRIIPEIKEWQNRPLEDIYPVIWMDAMHFKVRDAGKVVSKAVYSLLGVNLEGEKQVLGVYFGETESSSFWRQVLHELQLRGVKDIFIACIDNLAGFGDAIEDIFPRADVQLCLVHQMRNSMKYVSYKDLKALTKDLRKIYTAPNVEMAEVHLQQAEENWGAKYKIVFRSWHNNWLRLTAFYRYPPALRRVIYTTNPIESFHRMVRKVTKTKGAFTSEDAIVKQIYLATINANTKWSGTIYGWTSVKRDLDHYFEERIFKP